MDNWENIFMNKLEGYESPLPEGSFERFRQRRSSQPGSGKRFRRIALPALLAVAATIAVFFFARHREPADGMPGTDGDSVAAASSQTTETDSSRVAPYEYMPLEHVTPGEQIAEAGANSGDKPQRRSQNTASSASAAKQTDSQLQTGPQPQSQIQTKPEGHDTQATHEAQQSGIITDNSGDDDDTGEITTIDSHPIQDNQAQAKTDNIRTTPVKSGFNPEKAFLTAGSATMVIGLCTSGFGAAAHEPKPDPTVNDVISTYHFPVKTGITVSLPVSNKWHFISGVQYSACYSDFSSSGGDFHYAAHYLSIPMRMDRILASSKRFDLYVGGGIEGNFCLTATRNGMRLESIDAPSVSLIATGGVQLRITNSLGLYVEPGVNLNIPAANRMFETYRTEHPLMFSFATGIRININEL